MNRTLTLFCALLTLGQLSAQVPDAVLQGRDYVSQQLDKAVPAAAADRYFERQATRLDAGTVDTRGAIVKYNVAYVDAVANSGSSPLLIRATLWPDSLARIADPDGDFYWFIHAMADVLDPNSILINDTYIEDNLSVEFGQGKIYDVDSMAFYYLYQRVTPPSIVDTLRVYVYGEANITEQTFDGWPSAGESTDVCYARYNNANFRPNTAILEQYEFLLTSADTSSAFLARIAVPLDVNISKGNKIGAAFHFIPGQSYSLGDVLFDNGTLSIGTLNNFDLITYEEDDGLFPLSSVTDEGALNQGGIVETTIRYGINPLGWNTTYYPTFGFGAGWRSEHVLTEWVIGPKGAHFISGTTANDCEIQFSDLSNVDGITTWLWNFGDGSISLDQNPVYTYSENGTYTVELEVRDGGGTTYSYERNVVVANCGSGTGVRSIDGLLSFSVFPNPATSVLNLDLSLTSGLSMDFGIYASTGELVRTDRIEAGTSYRGSYDVSDLPAGFYTIKLQNGNQVATKGFMIAD
jgi:hypothetical protein